MQGGLLLNIVISNRAGVIELLASEDEALLVRWNPFLVLNLHHDVADGVRGLHIKGEGLHKDLHLVAWEAGGPKRWDKGEIRG
uniref:Uncharacterized protein n=1 Tax=Arundo donax TaxID=35708 RepID=A0A0A9AYZ8_ARUDO